MGQENIGEKKVVGWRNKSNGTAVSYCITIAKKFVVRCYEGSFEVDIDYLLGHFVFLCVHDRP